MSSPSRIQPPGRRIRWLARRPPETLPEHTVAPLAPAPRPRYDKTPQWGLSQDFSAPEPARTSRAQTIAHALPRVLLVAALVCVAAAAAQGLAYLLLVVNRGRPIPGLLAFVADAAVLLSGWLAILVMLAVFAAVALWLIDRRAAAYARLHTRDPRPRWQLLCYCLVPVVNLVAAPVLALELVRAQDRAAGSPPSRAHDRRLLFIRRWWVGWAALVIVSVCCVAYARAAGGLQHRADAMVYTTLTYLLAAAFVALTRTLVCRIDSGPDRGATKAEETRWLAV